MIIKDLRTNEILEFTDEELKNFIIETTHSRFESMPVRPEFTWMRPTAFWDFFVSNDYKTFTGVYLVTALKRINPDPNTRYILFTEYENPDLVNYIREDIPIFYIKHEIVHDDVSWLSEWFRSNMWNWFSFVDIDYLLANENKTLVIEEKFFPHARIWHWQMLSYVELLNDVLPNAYRIILKPSWRNSFIMNYYDKNSNQIKWFRENATKNEIYRLVSDTMNRPTNH